MKRLRGIVRHPHYHHVMAAAYALSAVPVFVFARDWLLELAIAITSWETAVTAHLGAGAAEETADR